MSDADHYILAVSDQEIARLRLQAQALAPVTRRALCAAGLDEGATVLDVGTGVGDVAFIAAELVGPSGQVRGVDIEAGMIAAAQADARTRGIAHVEFAQVGSADLDPRRYDLVVARFVLAQQADQVAFLQRLAAQARPGGALVIVDSANTGHDRWSMPPQPRYDALVRSLFSLTRELGHDHDVGLNLIPLFQRAGLPEPQVAAEWLVGGPRSVVCDYALRSMRSIFAAAGDDGYTDLPSADEIDRARDEVVGAAAQIAFQCIGTAWVRL